VTVIAYAGGSKPLRRLLASLPAILAGHAPDPHGIARAIQMRLGLRLMGMLQRAFVEKARGGTGGDGVTWMPLRPSTVRGRRRGRRGSRYAGRVEILRDTGRLLRSLTPGVDAIGPEGVLRTPPGRVIVGTNVPYAGYQHRGTRRIPARPLWPLDGRLPGNWTRELAATLKRGVLAAIIDLVQRGGVA
jgi:phage gpG-like protein